MGDEIDVGDPWGRGGWGRYYDCLSCSEAQVDVDVLVHTTIFFFHSAGILQIFTKQCLVVQIGIAKQDHAQVLRAELDDVTPRSVFTTKGPQRPGADMLMQAAAALASSSHVLAATSGSHQLSHRALSTAKDLFAEALKNPGT